MLPYVIEKINKSKLEGRTITAEPSQSLKKESVIGYTVHVNNLSFKLSSEDTLREIFEKEFGEVKKVHLIRDPVDGRSKGFAFVEFLDEATMFKAL